MGEELWELREFRSYGNCREVLSDIRHEVQYSSNSTFPVEMSLI